MTTQYTLTKEQYLEFRAKFKAEANARSLSAEDILLYNLVRAKNPKQGFTEVTNATKLANGASKWQGYERAADNIKWKSYTDYIRMRFGEAVANYVMNDVKQMRKLHTGDTTISESVPVVKPVEVQQPQQKTGMFSKVTSFFSGQS